MTKLELTILALISALLFTLTYFVIHQGNETRSEIIKLNKRIDEL